MRDVWGAAVGGQRSAVVLAEGGFDVVEMGEHGLGGGLGVVGFEGGDDDLVIADAGEADGGGGAGAGTGGQTQAAEAGHDALEQGVGGGIGNEVVENEIDLEEEGGVVRRRHRGSDHVLQHGHLAGG